MSKKVYISADYSEYDGDRDVVEELNRWGQDNLHKVDFIDMSKVSSGSVSNTSDCRICDLKNEFNSQINASSAVIIVIGDKTANRTAGSECDRLTTMQNACYCTPYKQNVNGRIQCKVGCVYAVGEDQDVGNINSFSYLRHEFEQAKKKNKDIIVLYNSTRKESLWLPSYLKEYEDIAMPFWIINSVGARIGDYNFIKRRLGFA